MLAGLVRYFAKLGSFGFRGPIAIALAAFALLLQRRLPAPEPAIVALPRSPGSCSTTEGGTR